MCSVYLGGVLYDAYQDKDEALRTAEYLYFRERNGHVWIEEDGKTIWENGEEVR